MDAELLIRLAGTVAGLAAGAGLKHKTTASHKAVGPAANAGVGLGAVAVGSMFGVDVDPVLLGGGALGVAAEFAASTEFVYAGGRSLVRIAKGIGRLFYRFL